MMPPTAAPPPQGAPPGPPPPNPMAQIQAQIAALTNQPTWEDLKQLLANDATRMFRVDIETDSTIAGDVQQEQQGMAELLQGIAQFVTGFGPAVQMGFIPIDAAKAMLMAAVRRFKMGKTVEEAIDQIPEGEQAAQLMQQHGQQGAPGKPDDSQAKLAQQEMIEETKRQQLQIDAAARAQEIQVKQAAIQAERDQAATEAQFRQQELALATRKQEFDEQKAAAEHDRAVNEAQSRQDLDRQKMGLDAMTQANTRLGENAGDDGEGMPTTFLDRLIGMHADAQKMHADAQRRHDQHMQAMTAGIGQALGKLAEAHAQAQAAATQPRRINVTRDPKTGRISGAAIGE